MRSIFNSNHQAGAAEVVLYRLVVNANKLIKIISLFILPDLHLLLPKSPGIPRGDKHTVFMHTSPLSIFNTYRDRCTAGEEECNMALQGLRP